jgi:hypothetical protein
MCINIGDGDASMIIYINIGDGDASMIIYINIGDGDASMVIMMIMSSCLEDGHICTSRCYYHCHHC